MTFDRNRHAALVALLSVAVVLAGSRALPEEAAESATHEDGVGRPVRLDGTPRRLLSLAPSITETLVSIGLGERIVGVSDFCRLPEEGPSPARVGGLINPDLERIVSLRPDLVLASTSGNYLEDADRITALGIPVYTCDTPTVDRVIETMETLGRILGAEREAESLTGSMRRRLEAIATRLAGKRRARVLFLVWGDPMLAPGRGAFINDALSLAGADSISAEASARWTEYDLEQVLTGRPEVILTVPDNRPFAESLRSRPEWASVPAVREGRIHVVSDAIQQPGPRIVDGIEEIAVLLHPAGGEEGRP